MPLDSLISIQFFYLALGIVLLLALAVIYLIIKLKTLENKKKEAELHFKSLESRVDNLQLETLESKLNPHLFKNILNSIQSHAYQTYFALDKLASVLDYILYESRHKFVTPKDEIEFALNLIEINKIKVSPLFELKIKTKINSHDALYTQKLLAPMISIDLIENAFKHADLQSALERFTEGDVYISHLKINLLEYKNKMLTAGWWAAWVDLSENVVRANSWIGSCEGIQ